jgi:hypothetical protein
LIAGRVCVRALQIREGWGEQSLETGVSVPVDAFNATIVGSFVNAESDQVFPQGCSHIVDLGWRRSTVRSHGVTPLENQQAVELIHDLVGELASTP